MKLFDNFANRSSDAPAFRRSEFTFLNETGLAQAFRIRALFEGAFEFYTGNKIDISARFRSFDNKTHLGAAFELLLHELARRRQLNPTADFPVNGGKVDLKVTSQKGRTIYVEARMLQRAENVHYAEACDAINRVKVPGVRLDVVVKRMPRRALKTSALVSKLADHLSQLDLTKFSTDATNVTASKFVCAEGDGILEILPVLQDGFGGGIGVSDYPEAEMADEHEIQSALARKNRKYDLNDAYVIAICSAKGFATPGMFRRAMFSGSPGDHRGFFVRSERAQLSAVLACQSFQPSSLGGASMQMFTNPKATHRLDENIFGCAPTGPEAAKDISECALSDAMGLPDDWLERE